jgi:tetratricopeptide (TPR) repeat protein
MPSPRKPGRKKARKRDADELREEALRPSQYLGYDRARLAAYLMGRGAFNLAEPQLRRAVWLNPFEPAFKRLLAWCLYKQARYADAGDWIAQALKQKPDDPDNRRVQRLIAARITPRSPPHEGAPL